MGENSDGTFVGEGSVANAAFDKALTSALEDIIKQHRAERPLPQVTLFDGETSIDLVAYVSRLRKYTGAAQSICAATLHYLQLLLVKNPQFALTEWNVHRLFLAALVVAIKFWEDRFYTDTRYAQIGGISAEELVVLQRCFLRMLRFDLLLAPEAYLKLAKRLVITSRERIRGGSAVSEGGAISGGVLQRRSISAPPGV